MDTGYCFPSLGTLSTPRKAGENGFRPRQESKGKRRGEIREIEGEPGGRKRPRDDRLAYGSLSDLQQLPRMRLSTPTWIRCHQLRIVRRICCPDGADRQPGTETGCPSTASKERTAGGGAAGRIVRQLRAGRGLSSPASGWWSVALFGIHIDETIPCFRIRYAERKENNEP
jgi:hypothetical protein